jgi:AraC-like DNA-binding protein
LNQSITEYLGGFAEYLPSAEPGVRVLAQRHIRELFALLSSPSSAVATHALRGEPRTVMLQRILRAIDQHSTNPELSGRKVASMLGITERYVQMLMEGYGETFSRYLLHIRLKKVAHALCSDGGEQQQISELAYSHGFNDLSYFNRSFKRYFGKTPGMMRHHSVKSTASVKCSL